MLRRCLHIRHIKPREAALYRRRGWTVGAAGGVHARFALQATRRCSLWCWLLRCAWRGRR
jgi:hypothetical protein